MKRKRKLLSVAFLLVLLTIGSFSSKFIFADEEESSSEGKVSLTIKAEFDSGEDVEDGLVFDLYKVAEFGWIGTDAKYAITGVESSFSGVFSVGQNIGINIMPDEDGNISFYDENLDYDVLNEKASTCLGKIYSGSVTKVGTVKKGDSIELTENVLYLAVARGTNATEKKDYLIEDKNGESPVYRSFANSKNNTYIFMPYLIFLTSDNPVMPIDLNEDVEFNDEVVVVKYEVTDRLGDFRVDKILTSIAVLNDEPIQSMFNFRVEWFEDQARTKKQGERIVTIYAPDCESVLLKDLIPVGSYVTCTEFYCGPGYKRVGSAVVNPSRPVYIPQIVDGELEDILHAEFTNEPDEPGDHGYGINNHLVVTESKEWDSYKENTAVEVENNEE